MVGAAAQTSGPAAAGEPGVPHRSVGWEKVSPFQLKVVERVSGVRAFSTEEAVAVEVATRERLARVEVVEAVASLKMFAIQSPFRRTFAGGSSGENNFP